MVFLNPLLLFGLAAASIPIILHLLNLRKLKTVEFSTLRFLKELQKTKMRRVKIRQWLLLALRTLAIIFLVLAFARPTLKGSLAGNIGTHARTTAIIIIDDSPSMGLRNEGGPFISQAKETASKILELMNEGDEAYLIPSSSILSGRTYNPLLSKQDAGGSLEDLTVSSTFVQHAKVLTVAASILTESKNFNQEVYLITDAQTSHFSVDDTLRLFDARVKFILIDLNTKLTVPPQNLGIISAEITSRILTVHSAASLQTTIHNYGVSPVRDLVLSAYLDGSRVSQKSLDLEPNGTATVDLSVIPKRPGILECYLEIEEDAMEADNKRHLILDVPAEVRVLVVGEQENHTTLPALALSAAPESASKSLYSVTRITTAKMSALDLSVFDVIILAGVNQLSSSMGERIASFAKGGGGVIAFPGGQNESAPYNSSLLQPLGVPKIQHSQPDRQADPPSTSRGFLTFAKIDYGHPILSGMFQEKVEPGTHGLKIESPRIFRSVLTSPGRKGHVIISLSDGTPFLTEFTVESGRFLLFSVGPDLEWSDFPVKGIFVPLMHRAVLYASSNTEGQTSFIVGETISSGFRSRSTLDGHSFVLASPSGIEEKVVLHRSPVTGIVSFTSLPTVESGNYSLYEAKSNRDGGRSERIPIALSSVNIDPAESDLRRIPKNELQRFVELVGLTEEQTTSYSDVGNIATEITESRLGVELWKHFFILALFVVLAEMLIGREPRTQTTKGV